MKRILCLFLSLVFCASLFACEHAAKTTQKDPPATVDTGESSADYTALYEVLKTAPGDLEAFTPESAKALQEATAAVRYNLPESEQATVDAYTTAIREAVAALKERLRFGSLSEIISYVDGLGIDFSDLASFSMDGLFTDVILPEGADAGEAYANETCFLGDSITLYMHGYSDIPSENIYGVGSINPQNAAQDKIVTLENGTPATFAEAMREKKPARIVVTIGTNSMLMESIDYLTYFAKLIEDLKTASPDSDILIQSTSPLTASYEAGMRLLTNKNINRSNLLLAGLAVYEGVYFLNSAEALKNDSGTLDTVYDLGEGYGHINRNAYDVWVRYLRTHPVVKA